jgi:hypothetical protein
MARSTDGVAGGGLVPVRVHAAVWRATAGAEVLMQEGLARAS